MKKVQRFTEKEKKLKLEEIENIKEEKLNEGTIDDFTKKTSLSKIIAYTSLSLALVLMITYSIMTVVKSEDLLTQLSNIISTFILSIFTVFFLFTSLFADNKKGRIFIIIAALLLSLYSGFNILVSCNVIKLSEQVTVMNFYRKDITEVTKWAEEHDIFVETIYENSEVIEQYKVISQSVDPGTSIKNITKITIIVSDGPNPEKATVIPSMIGWDVDKAIQYIDENYLTNVNIEFEFNDTIKRDFVFSQNIESTLKRNEKLELKVSLGKKDEFKYVTMENLIGLDEFHATIWLKRNRIAYEIQYGYSEDYDQGVVIKQQDKSGKTIDVTKNPTTVIIISRNSQITVPNLQEMTRTEITSWATENKLKISFKEEYDESIKKGKVISSSRFKGDTVKVGETIQITISKGQIYMPEFTTVDEFRNWATENEISYNINYEFSNKVKSGKLISSSHKENELIKNTDTVELIISQGGTTKVPNFSNMTKSEIETACKNANLICEYKYETSSTVEKDKFIKQSMRSGSEVPHDTTITITLSKGN